MSLISAEKTGVNEYSLELTIDALSFGESLTRVFNKNKGKIAIPGFRKGKAPRSFIEKYYGENVFYDDALEDAFPKVYEAAIKEANIDAVDSPRDFDIKTIGKHGVELSCKVTVKPEITLGEYRGLRAVKKEVSVSADEVTQELANIQKKNVRITDIDDRAVENGDKVTIDFEGFTNGVAFKGGAAENHELTIGSGEFIPGFEEQIIGHSKDECFDINVTFPEEYAPELAGKDAVFKIIIKAIQHEELPELDDDFAKDNNFDTLDEFKVNIEEELLNAKQSKANNEFENDIFTKLAEIVEADIPDCMIEKSIDNLISDYKYQIESSGIPFDAYLQYMGMNSEGLRDTYRERATQTVKIDLALEKIIEKEAIEISEEELEEEYNKYAENYKLDVESIKKAIRAEDITKGLKTQKAVDIIISSSIAEKEDIAEENEVAEDKEEGKTEANAAIDADGTAAKKKPAAKKATAKKADADTQE